MATQSKTKEPAAAGPDTKGLSIASRADQGFRRAGRAFGPAPTVVPLSELTEEQVKLLKGESKLIVTEVDIEPAKADQAKADQAKA